jgi:uncharacterized protein YabN with tetrapyrrole methylase and pyrophosphatase domain
MAGSLTVVGTGYKLGGHITVESMAHIRIAEKVLANVDPIAHEWLLQLNPSAESLSDCYAPGKDRRKTYREMVERILSPVRIGHRVCAVFYGHPGVGCDAGHEAVKKARKEGFVARMLPGISAEDCLFADLGIDPTDGCQHLEATDFLLLRLRLDVTRPVVLWQVGVVGVETAYPTREIWNRDAFNLLVAKLVRTYSPRHRVYLYEASSIPTCEPIIHKIALARLPRSRVTIASTLYIPPLRESRVDEKMLARLNSISNLNG